MLFKLRAEKAAHVATFLALFSVAACGQTQTPVLPGVEFGYRESAPLLQRIGPAAVLTTRYVRGVGGVAFVREATGRDGWSVASMTYDGGAADGQRLTVVFSKKGGATVSVRPSIWDWELLPLVRFVSTDYDAAFTFFGERIGGPSSNTARSQAVGYHPAFKNTLLGLRLMQLDLYLFTPSFLGFITTPPGDILLGPGEIDSLDWRNELAKPQARERQLRANFKRWERAQEFFQRECRNNRSRLCKKSGQPFQSYIVGDTLSPVSFGINGGRLEFQTNGVCWDFSRPTEPDEASTPGLTDTLRLEALSKAFCSLAKNELDGIYPLVYRAANRALTYSALLRSFKRQDTDNFARFADPLRRLAVPNQIVTPTELMAP